MKKINNKIKRKLRNRKKLKKVSDNRFRISVSKSLKNLSAQIIDDKERKTLVSASSIEKEVKDKNINRVYFDRGSYKYHGRVKIFAETLRKNGIKF